MGIRNNALAFAMESEGAGEGGEEIVGGADSLEEAAGDVAEQGTDIEATVEDIDVAQDDIAQIEAVSDIAQSTVDSGEGMAPEAAAIAEESLGRIYRKYGIAKKAMPSLESFGSKSRRITATKVAIEGFSDKVRSIWEAIVKVFKNLWKKIKEFFARVTDVNLKLEARAKALIEKIGKLNSTSKKKSFEDESVAKSLKNSKNAKFDLNELKADTDRLGTLTSDTAKEAEKIVTLIKKYVKEETTKAENKEIRDALLKAVNGDATDGKEGPLPGNRSIEITMPKASENEEDGNRFMVAKVPFNPNIKNSDNKTILIGNAADLKSLCQKVIEITGSLTKIESYGKDFDKKTEDVLKEIENKLKDADKKDDEESKKEISKKIKFTSSAMAFTANYLSSVTGISVESSKDILHYVEKCIDNWNKND